MSKSKAVKGFENKHELEAAGGNTLVILSPNDPQGRKVLKGVFGELVGVDEERAEVEVRLDLDLVACSAIFAPYANGATFKTGLDEAMIVTSPSRAVIDSLKATLIASLAQNWGSRYSELMSQRAGDSLLYRALESEKTIALQGAQRLIDKVDAAQAQLPIASLTIANDDVGVVTEVVLLKAPIPTEANHLRVGWSEGESAGNRVALSDFSRKANFGFESNDQVYRNDGEMTVLISKGVTSEAFSKALAAHNEVFSFVLKNLASHVSDESVMMSADEARHIIDKYSITPVSSTFSDALDLNSPDSRQDIEPVAAIRSIGQYLSSPT